MVEPYQPIYTVKEAAKVLRVNPSKVYELITRANDQADSLVGKVDNDANGRATIVSQIQGIGTAMVEEGKLVSCTVTESTANVAEGDSAWFRIECQDKDSAERIYLTYVFQFNTQG